MLLMIPWFRLPMSWGIHLCFQFCVKCSVAKVQSLKLENWKPSLELTYSRVIPGTPKDMGPPKMVSGTHTIPISLGIRKWEGIRE